jgi:hypothetical protein
MTTLNIKDRFSLTVTCFEKMGARVSEYPPVEIPDARELEWKSLVSLARSAEGRPLHEIITPDRFPVGPIPDGATSFVPSLVDFECSTQTDSVLAVCREINPSLQPAGLIPGGLFAGRHPKSQQDDPIVLLGALWKSSICRVPMMSYLVLDNSKEHRTLAAANMQDFWRGRRNRREGFGHAHRFLFVTWR